MNLMNTSPGSFIAAMGAVVYAFAIVIAYACTLHTVALALIAWALIVVGSIAVGAGVLRLMDDEDGTGIPARKKHVRAERKSHHHATTTVA